MKYHLKKLLQVGHAMMHMIYRGDQYGKKRNKSSQLY